MGAKVLPMTKLSQKRATYDNCFVCVEPWGVEILHLCQQSGKSAAYDKLTQKSCLDKIDPKDVFHGLKQELPEANHRARRSAPRKH